MEEDIGATSTAVLASRGLNDVFTDPARIFSTHPLIPTPTRTPTDIPTVVTLKPTGEIIIVPTPTREATATEAPKSFITPGGKELPLGSHLDATGDENRYITPPLVDNLCPGMNDITNDMPYDDRYPEGGREYRCVWNDKFMGGVWVGGVTLVYPPKQP